MYIYNKATIYEIYNNDDFIKVEINNNIIFCLNKNIFNDIKKNLK